MQDTKRFKATWGEGYYNPGSKEITLADITEENGWDDWAIEKVMSLEVQEACDCSDYSGILFVQRIA